MASPHEFKEFNFRPNVNIYDSGLAFSRKAPAAVATILNRNDGNLFMSSVRVYVKCSVGPAIGNKGFFGSAEPMPNLDQEFHYKTSNFSTQLFFSTYIHA